MSQPQKTASFSKYWKFFKTLFFPSIKVTGMNRMIEMSMWMVSHSCKGEGRLPHSPLAGP